MTYDDWKTRSDRDENPEPFDLCETCGHPEDYCDCPCCVEPPEQKEKRK